MDTLNMPIGDTTRDLMLAMAKARREYTDARISELRNHCDSLGFVCGQTLVRCGVLGSDVRGIFGGVVQDDEGSRRFPIFKYIIHTPSGVRYSVSVIKEETVPFSNSEDDGFVPPFMRGM